MFKTILASTALASALLISPSLQAATPADALVQASRFDDIISLDPAEMYEISAFEIVTNAYDKLVAYDIEDTSRIVPQLAEAWEISEDGTTFTFKLREDVTFHSGNPFTAEDVVYSLARFAALDKGPAFLIHDLGVTPDNYEDVLRAVDEHTFEMTLDQGYAPSFVLNVLSGGNFSIIDSALAQENEVESDWGSAWLKNNSAGSGPFQLDQMVPNDRIVMSRFDDYWQGTPELGRLMWRHVEEPASQRLLLEQG
ncbi:MAG TPA: ABC transporter substrate-binding protein, partial [Kiloniellales bacterium]|nr:ABC transporter substrate-binding protein [Kiloniellales bacterium]